MCHVYYIFLCTTFIAAVNAAPEASGMMSSSLLLLLLLWRRREDFGSGDFSLLDVVMGGVQDRLGLSLLDVVMDGVRVFSSEKYVNNYFLHCNFVRCF